MAKRRRSIYKGARYQGDTPNWEPLLSVLGEYLTGHFMWMFEVALTDGTKVQAYKHIDTRCYVHLDSDGVAYVYEDEDRYRRFDLAELLAAVFAPLPGLAGVTAEQIEASLAAVRRVRNAASSAA
jgi:hypothetical protein